MKNKGKKKSFQMNKYIRLGLSAIGVLLSGTLIWSGIQDLQTTLELKNSISTNTVVSQELDDELTELDQTKKNLTNPDYMKYYARGEYMVTKEGEQVFKFPSSESKSE